MILLLTQHAIFHNKLVFHLNHANISFNMPQQLAVRRSFAKQTPYSTPRRGRHPSRRTPAAALLENPYKTIIAYTKTIPHALSIPAQSYILITPKAEPTTIASIKKISQPILFIHGTADNTTPPSHTEALSLHATNKKVIWIKDANHTYNQPYHTYQLVHHIIHHQKQPMCYTNS